MSTLLVALGGALGTALRYGCAVSLGRAFGTAFPYGTLAVNLIGSFLLGVIAEVFSGASVAGTDLRLILGVGVMGGFTTYSSFNLELLRMLEQGSTARACAYFGATVVGCLAGGFAGLLLARAITSGAS